MHRAGRGQRRRDEHGQLDDGEKPGRNARSDHQAQQRRELSDLLDDGQHWQRSEPSFSDTAGTTTADNTVTWTSLGVVGNFTAFGAPHARLNAAFTATWGESGTSSSSATTARRRAGQHINFEPGDFHCSMPNLLRRPHRRSAHDVDPEEDGVIHHDRRGFPGHQRIPLLVRLHFQRMHYDHFR